MLLVRGGWECGRCRVCVLLWSVFCVGPVVRGLVIIFFSSVIISYM